MRFIPGTIWTQPVSRTAVNSFKSLFRIKFTPEHIHIALFSRKFSVRYSCRIEKKERFVFISFQKINCSFLDQIGAVSSGFAAVIIMKHNFLMIVPKMIGIIVMCKTLTVITEEFIE